MKFFKILSMLGLSSLFFMQCSSQKKLQDTVSFKTDHAYFQHWVAGIKGGGSGVNVFIPVISELKNLKLDSIYFKGRLVPLETKPQNPNLYIGRVSTAGNQQPDFTDTSTSIPFELKDNEAVVTYQENGKTKYYKIENIEEKKAKHFPSAQPKR